MTEWKSAHDLSGSIQGSLWALDAYLSEQTGIPIRITPVQWLFAAITFFVGLTCLIEYALRRCTEASRTKLERALARHRARWRRWNERRAAQQKTRRRLRDDEEEGDADDDDDDDDVDGYRV
tara:strand:+ start:388 stop:753 length:366 start_codon:yes stop_codon:yes gene_type:complete